MDAIKRTLLFLLISTVLGLTLVIVLPSGEVDRDNADVLLVGCGDDITNCLLDQVLERYHADGMQDVAGVSHAEEETAETAEDMDSYLFLDCCSDTGMWALVNHDIDMGFYCSHVALSIVNKVEGVSIYGPVIMNGEVLGYWDEPENMETIAVPAKRSHLKGLAEEQYPWVKEIKEVDAKSIAYAFGDHQIDGAVLDISRAFKLPDYQYTSVTDQDYVSFCLVVRDEVIDTPQFQSFIACYNATVEELNSPEKMQELYGMDDQFWENTRLKFLYLSEPEQAVGQ